MHLRPYNAVFVWKMCQKQCTLVSEHVQGAHASLEGQSTIVKAAVTRTGIKL